MRQPTPGFRIVSQSNQLQAFSQIKLALIILVVASIAALFAWADWPLRGLAPGVQADRIIIEKSAHQLTLMHLGSPLKQYTVALGRGALGPKEKEGDRKTPEGIYRILEHKRQSAFHLALRISYPNEHDVAHANLLGVSPGSDIMIHGMKNGLGFLGRIHRWVDWTAGCIAVTNPEIDEIGRLVADGTPVEIRP